MALVRTIPSAVLAPFVAGLGDRFHQERVMLAADALRALLVGSIAVVAGNIPFRTLTAPVYIFGEIERGAPRSAAAVSIVLLALALALHGVALAIERRTGARHA